VSLDDPTRIALADKPQDRYDYNKRKITTLGRYLSRRLGLRYRDSVVASVMAEFVNYEAYFRYAKNIKDEYFNDKLPRSCMTGMDCTEFYDSIEECQLLIYNDRARALVWYNRYIDRIYPNEPAVVAAYTRYAVENGMVTLEENTYGSSWVGHDVSIDIDFDNCSCGIPYLDTLRYYSNSRLTTYPTDSNACCCDSTDGCRPSQCDKCGGYTFDALFDIDGMECCSDCAESSDCCDFCRCHTFQDITIVDGMGACESCADQANHCESCRDYTMYDLFKVDDEHVCSDCADKAYYCHHCGQHTHKDFILVDGDMVCPDCADKAHHCVECDTYTFINDSCSICSAPSPF